MMEGGGILADTGIIRRRLENQLLVHTGPMRPDEIVRWFGAVQAQEYLGALWAVGVRVPGISEGEVERAIAGGSILRTWPMRGTIHLVPAEDAKWMLDLLTPRVIARSAARYRELGLDEAAFDRAREVIHEALSGGESMSRPSLMRHLDAEGVPTANQRGYHIVCHLAQRGFICFGPREGKHPSIVLLDEWATKQRVLDRDEALAELAGRYFRSHGPATLHDFAWWSGLTMADARAAVGGIGGKLVREEIGDGTYFSTEPPPSRKSTSIESPSVHLLPPFDEYTVAYRNRGAVLDPAHAKATENGLTNTIVLDGRVIGAWKRKLEKEKVVVTPNLLEPIGEDERDTLAEAAHRYGAFLSASVVFEHLRP